MRQYDDEQRSQVERIVGQDLDETTGKGKPLSSRAAQTQRSIDAYLKSGVRPRWMERVADIDAGIAYERRRLERAYRALQAECDGDDALFAARWLREPDVGLALDPEWHVNEGEIPGQVIGSVDASVVDQVSSELAAIVRAGRLPEKLLLVHQFTDNMIANKDRLRRHPGVALTINVDGFGDRPNKISKYDAFTSEAVRFNDGFKLFYEEDTNLMAPRDVLALTPPPDVVVYE